MNRIRARAHALAARPPAAELAGACAVQLGHHAVPAAREQRERSGRRSAQAPRGPMGRGERPSAGGAGGVPAGCAPPVRALQPRAAAPPAAAGHREGSHGVPQWGARTVKRGSRATRRRRRPSRRCPSRRRPPSRSASRPRTTPWIACDPRGATQTTAHRLPTRGWKAVGGPSSRVDRRRPRCR